MNDWDFKVRGIAGDKYHPYVQKGEVICETVHRGVSSAEFEVRTWQNRMRSMGTSYIDHIELIDLRPNGGETNLKINHLTKIDWHDMYRKSIQTT